MTTHAPDSSDSSEHNGHLIRVLVADDHAMFRDALRALLLPSQGLEIVGEASDGDAAIELAHRCKPDILLLDMAMPRQNGMQVLSELASADLQMRVLIVTGMIAKPDILRALQLGARGVVFKSATGGMLTDAIHRVMAGQYWIGQEGVASLVAAIRNLTHQPVKFENKYGVTRREMEIISAVVRGCSNADIAHAFSISEPTVKHHLSNIFDKLGVHNRLELAIYAINHRLLDDKE